jgi:beta-1,4-N-acetylglucosaminyltransferase
VVNHKGGKVIKIALICSHGGHLTEMLELLEAFGRCELFFVTYASKRADELKRQHRVYTIDNIGASPMRLLRSLPAIWRILRRERPDVLVSTGSEIAIPFFVLATLSRTRTIFVESYCHVKTPSRTGRVVYPFSDVFLVQWYQLLEAYGPKARYEGGLL